MCAEKSTFSLRNHDEEWLEDTSFTSHIVFFPFSLIFSTVFGHVLRFHTSSTTSRLQIAAKDGGKDDGRMSMGRGRGRSGGQQ
ncbi:uncharacterized protein SCHCODRAFT_02136895 [Schizophyllum commune H4-8]|uniref:uncharacterized protein n=1 Tax=Schizophyllum commune (strain H4-8 / FGSC 9210) TaxID=578458 RepID=UPI00215FB36A|nr:uncharacterized protein SCHCODRAFT_02136895 [Schizophyllum commune H4-8]KAI5884907.1 hypothetical protein SCHCODRAFT_02136895 [Schizophyllum commune H4-8]